MANLSTTMTLHIELSGLDRDLLERVCENLEWYRKHLQEQRYEAQKEREGEQALNEINRLERQRLTNSKEVGISS